MRHLTRWQIVLLSLFGVRTLMLFAWPAWRAHLSIEIDPNEAWNAFQVSRLNAGLPLYPEKTALITNNYPPLSFLLIHWLDGAGMASIHIGRILSLLATLVGAGAIYAIVAAMTPGRIGAAIAAIFYVATISRFNNYAGMSDPQLPALALMLCAMAWAVRTPLSARALALPLLVMVAAGFYKHNLVSIPATVLICSLRRDWRQGLAAALIGIACVAIGFALCLGAFGAAFVDQLNMPRVTSWTRPFSILGRMQLVLPALLMWGYVAWRARGAAWVGFTSTFVGLALADHLLQQTGEGVDDNSQFALIAAAAIGIGLAYANMPPIRIMRHGRTAILAVLLVRLMVSDRMEPYLLLSDSFRAQAAQSEAAMAAEVERVARIPGPVACSIATVCLVAGKPFVFDPFYVGQKVSRGLLPPDELANRLEALQLRIEVIAPAATGFLQRKRSILDTAPGR